MNDSAVLTSDGLGVRGILVLTVASVLSAPGYLAFVLSVIGWLVNLVLGNYSHSWIAMLPIGTWIYYLCFFGILVHPVALLVAIVSSFLPIGRRLKLTTWTLSLGGLAAWLVSFGSLWR